VPRVVIFIELLRDLFPDNMEKVRLGKQKCTNIIRQVLGFNIIKENVQFLRDHKFSIFVDETTDRATKTQCAIVAMAFDPEQLIINIILLDLIELEDERADTIAAEIARVLEDRKIQNDLIGFCADTCNIMFGQQHSVSTILKEKYPWIVAVKCTCHSLHLAASYAAKQLPRFIEDLCKNVHDYFQSSPKRTKVSKNSRTFTRPRSTSC